MGSGPTEARSVFCAAPPLGCGVEAMLMCVCVWTGFDSWDSSEEGTAMRSVRLEDVACDVCVMIGSEVVDEVRWGGLRSAGIG